MAGKKSKIAVELELMNGKYLAKINQSSKSTENFAKKAGKSFSMMKGSMIAGTLAVGGMVMATKKFLVLADRQISAEKRLATVLETTGGAAGLTAKEITSMASSLQSVTTFGDEAIIEGQNLLLTFTKIGKDVFPEATEAMLNMSAALGQGMKESAIQLGKALNDPILGISALRRVGIQLTKQQEEQIRKFTEMGEISKAQNIILGELETQFGNTARAMAETPVGKWQQVSNLLGDIGEDIGKEIVPGFSNMAEAMKGILAEDGAFRTMLDGMGAGLNLVANATAKAIRYYDIFLNKAREWAATSVHKDAIKDLEKLEKSYKKTYGVLWEHIVKTGDAHKEELKILETARERVGRYQGEISKYGEKMDELSQKIAEMQSSMQESEDARLEKKIEADAAEKSAEETAHAKKIRRAKEEQATKARLVKKHLGIVISSLQQEKMADRAAKTEAANYYQKYLNSKLGLDSTYTQGLLTLSSFANTFMGEENSKMFALGQVLAVSQAAINTALAITKVLSQLGIFGPPAAAVIGAAGMLQARNIAKQSPPRPPKSAAPVVPVTKLAEGGYIPGTTMGTPIIAGEGGRSEAIIPLERAEIMEQMGGININVEGSIIDTDGLMAIIEDARDRQASLMGGSNYSVGGVY